MASWTASVMRMPDPDAERYVRLCRLLDGVIAQPQHSRYLVLPELALPAHWFIRIARKLQEIRYATAIEKQYSKQDILIGYLNLVNFGGTTYGIEAAAEVLAELEND